MPLAVSHHAGINGPTLSVSGGIGLRALLAVVAIGSIQGCQPQGDVGRLRIVPLEASRDGQGSDAVALPANTALITLEVFHDDFGALVAEHEVSTGDTEGTLMVEKVPAGLNRQVTVEVRSSNSVVLRRGVADGVEVVADQTTTVTIDIAPPEVVPPGLGSSVIAQRCDGAAFGGTATDEVWLPWERSCDVPEQPSPELCPLTDGFRGLAAFSVGFDENLDFDLRPPRIFMCYPVVGSGGAALEIELAVCPKADNFIEAILGAEEHDALRAAVVADSAACTYPQCGEPECAESIAIPVLAEVSDVIGNRLPGSGATTGDCLVDLDAHLVIGTVHFDPCRPATPNVAEPDCITYRRWPWGSGTVDGNHAADSPSFRVDGSTACEPLAVDVVRLTALNGPDPLTAGRIGESTVEDFVAGGLELEPADRPIIYLSTEDLAGNRSAVVPVHDIEWIATLGGKQAGSVIANPHLFRARSYFDGLLDSPYDVEPDATGLAQEITGSVVTPGAGAWQRKVPLSASFWPPRTRAAATYHGSRAEVLVFGGTADLLSDTGSDQLWSWDGASWTARCGSGLTCSGPPAVGNTGLVYDPVRDVSVLFGGGSVSNGDQTWEWDGDQWRLVCGQGTTCTGPSARKNHAMTFDTGRSRVVLFGGDAGAWFAPNALEDLWEWDGQSWALRCSGQAECGGPSPRLAHAMAHDPRRGVSVLVGGYDQGTDYGDTWEWDGTQWSLGCDTGDCQGLGPRLAHVMVFDSQRGRVVLFGGLNPTVAVSDTWEWNGSLWEQRCLDGVCGPAARVDAVMTFDERRERVVLAGGHRPGSAPESDVWEWDGGGWARRCNSAADPSVCGQPPKKRGASAGYFVGLKGLVLAGGVNVTSTGPVYDLDNWIWNGTTWRQLCVDCLTPGRIRHAMTEVGNSLFLTNGDAPMGGPLAGAGTWRFNAFDSSWTDAVVSPAPPTSGQGLAVTADGDLLLFGGEDQFGGMLHEAWIGTVNASADVSWSLACSGAGCGGISARRDHAMALDESSGRVILFGGWDVAENAETWEWDGAQWLAIDTGAPPVHPSARYGHAMVVDGARGEILLFGGAAGWGLDQQTFSDLWAWANGRWVEYEVAVGPRPSGRLFHAMAFDPVRRRSVLFGGVDIVTLGDTWEWDGGADQRAGHLLAIDFRAADGPDPRRCLDPNGRCPIREVSGRWVARATGTPEGELIAGSRLLSWRDGRWQKTLYAQSPLGGDWDETRWSLVAPADLGRVFVGPEQTLHLAMTPAAINGDSSGPSEIESGFMEVRVRYVAGVECGDGQVDRDEECDDGRQCADGTSCGDDPTVCPDPSQCLPWDNDGCSAECRDESCGNGTLDPGEDCDDGANGDPCDGCLDRCLFHTNFCGDGYLCAAETCDDGDNDAGDGCGPLCALETDSCLSDLVTSPGTAARVLTGDTTLGTDNLAGGCSPSSSPELVYALDLPHRGDLWASTFSPATTFDTLVSLRSVCADPLSELGCNDDGPSRASAVSGSWLSAQPDIPVRTYVVVEGFGPQAGAFELALRPVLDTPDRGVTEAYHLEGTLEAGHPQFTKPTLSCAPGSAGSYHYEAHWLHGEFGGNRQYDFTGEWTGGGPGEIIAYQDNFDPAEPTQNCVMGGLGTLADLQIRRDEIWVIVVTTAIADETIPSYRLEVFTP